MSEYQNPLVVIGDSLSQAFMSGAVSRVDLSYGAMIAEALGEQGRFRTPSFEGAGGLPLNIEKLLREMSGRFGEKVSWYEFLPMLMATREFMAGVEKYWERGAGSQPVESALYHNLAVWGFELRDAYTVNARIARHTMGEPDNNWLNQIPEHPMLRTAARVLDPGFDAERDGWSQFDVADELARQGGIERLVVALGANNVLGTVLSLEMRWSTEFDLQALPFERQANIYHPDHFARLYARLAERVDAVGAKHVFVATVPHVTIPPATRGVSPNKTLEGGGSAGRRYYEYYTRPWIWDDDFNPEKHEHLTREQAIEIDGAIDEYNRTIRETAAKRGWHVADMGGMLDNLAFRSSEGRPSYMFPEGLVSAIRENPYTSYLVDNDRFRLDTRYLRAVPYGAARSGIQRLSRGGLFSLDGVHPTVVGQGLLADLFLETMRKAGAAPADAALRWDTIVESDMLVTDPPALLVNLASCLASLERHWGLSEVLQLLND